jgi:hypothetical protein
LAKAQGAVQNLLSQNLGNNIVVMVRQGTYYLPSSPTNPGTLSFTKADSGTPGAQVLWENYPGESPVISGGVPITGWTNTSGSIWTVNLSSTAQPFENLFYNGTRRLPHRAYSSQSQYSNLGTPALGTMFRIASEVDSTESANCPIPDNNNDGLYKCFDRFKYTPTDFTPAAWKNLVPATGNLCGQQAGPANLQGAIEIGLFEAWTFEKMRISCVDTVNSIIYFTAATPERGSGGQLNYHGPTEGHRFTIENVVDGSSISLSLQPGQWYVDHSTSPWTLYYNANSGENPNVDTVVIPQIAANNSVITAGPLILAKGLSYVSFIGLTFEVDNYVPGPSGFNADDNGENELPGALMCVSCQFVTFDSDIVRHTSASGVYIDHLSGSSTESANIVVQNSAFYDIGDSGIHIGHTANGSDTDVEIPSFVTVQNNIVQGYSRVFPDGEGIATGSVHDSLFTQNDINDGYHAGINVCNANCPFNSAISNGTSNVVTSYNHIWNTMQGLTADGGTIYYGIGGLNSGTGNQILNNLVHDVTDSSIIDQHVPGSGYGGHGLYLDVQSANMNVQYNVVYRVAASGIFQAQGPAAGQGADTFDNNIIAYARQSMYLEQAPWPQGCPASSALRANITNNIFYFDKSDTDGFFPIDGCADSCGFPYNQFQNFQGTMYWRTDGGFSNYAYQFHYLPNPLEGQEASSCNGDPPDRLKDWDFLDLNGWQTGSPIINGNPLPMREDPGAVNNVNPNFGSTGMPSDYMLSGPPFSGSNFNYSQTNATIQQAGRNNPVIIPPSVPETFPTYTYSNSDF